MSLHDDFPPDARPREKLLARGAAALSDSELLALLLRTGTKGRGVLYMAADVLEAFGGLAGLFNASAED
jgi:DNA repair protein RadC